MRISQIDREDTLPVRHQVLWPAKPLKFSKVDGDESATHYGAFIDATLVCGLGLYFG